MTDQVDMSHFIAARSDQMNADDLLDAPRTITITKVSATPDSAEQPVSIHYEGDNGKPFKPCKTVRRIMVGVWGKDASQYVGRSMTLYRDPAVAFGGMQVGGIRVSHMSNMTGEKTVALMVTRGRKAPFKVLPLEAARPARDHTDAENSVRPNAKDDPAVKWAAAYIAKLATLDDLSAVQAFAGEKAAKLAELQTARPELHAKVAAAVEARTSELGGLSAFEDDLTSGPAPAAEPTTLLDEVDQGSAQQPGEDPAAARANAIIDEIKAAISTLDIDTLLAREAVHIDAMEEGLAAMVRQVAGIRKSEITAAREKAKESAE